MLESGREWECNSEGPSLLSRDLQSDGEYFSVSCHTNNAKQPSSVLVLRWAALSETTVSGEKWTVDKR